MAGWDTHIRCALWSCTDISILAIWFSSYWAYLPRRCCMLHTSLTLRPCLHSAVYVPFATSGIMLVVHQSVSWSFCSWVSCTNHVFLRCRCLPYWCVVNTCSCGMPRPVRLLKGHSKGMQIMLTPSHSRLMATISFQVPMIRQSRYGMPRLVRLLHSHSKGIQIMLTLLHSHLMVSTLVRAPMTRQSGCVVGILFCIGILTMNYGCENFYSIY